MSAPFIALFLCAVFLVCPGMAYKPSALVRQTHQTPHLSPKLVPRSNEFQLDYSSSTADIRSNTYGESVVVLPALIGALGILSLAIFFLTLCFRCCWKKRCGCAPDESSLKTATKEDLESWTHRETTRRDAAKRWFVVFIVLTALVIHAAMYGNAEISTATTSGISEISFFKDTFQALEDQGNTMSDLGLDISSEFAAAQISCPAVSATSYQTYIDEYNTAVNDYLNTVSPIAPKMEGLSNMADTYGVTYKDYAMWITYCICMFLLLMYLLAHIVRWRSIIYLCALISTAMLVFILLCCVAEMILAVRSVLILCLYYLIPTPLFTDAKLRFLHGSRYLCSTNGSARLYPR